MKKILTVSLVAVMAVSAAHANIASTKYVDDKETALNAAIALKADSSTVTALETAYQQADTALDGRIDTLESDNSTNKTNITNLQTAVSGLQGTGDNAAATKKQLADLEATVTANELDIEGKMTALTGRVGTNETNIATNTAGVAANTAKFADYSTTAQMNAELAKKQDKLTAGNNITIGADGKTISADVVNSTDGLTKDQLATAIPSVSMVEGLISDSNADTATTVGELSDLTTSAKGNIVAAINEVDANADAAKAAADAKLASVSSTGSGVVKTVVQNGTAVNVTAGAVAKSELAAGVQTSLGLADSALQKADITSGAANGTISVEGTDVAVKGLGSAAYVATTAFDTAGSAATAKSEAIAAAKTETQTQVSALENGQVKINKTGIATINTNLGPLAGVTIPAACATDAVCSLVMNKGTVAWEVISY